MHLAATAAALVVAVAVVTPRVAANRTLRLDAARDTPGPKSTRGSSLQGNDHTGHPAEVRFNASRGVLRLNATIGGSRLNASFRDEGHAHEDDADVFGEARPPVRPESSRPTSMFVGRMHFAYRLPENGKKRGAVLLLHACGRRSFDWFGWGRVPGTERADGGLPEETAMADALLEKGLAAIAPDAPPFPGGCWNPPHDAPLVAFGIEEVRRKLGLSQLPLLGLGASSGGVLLAHLPRQGVIFKALPFNVSPGGALGPNPGLFGSPGWPRSSFVHMPPDPFAPPESIQAAAAALRAAGTPVQVIAVRPRPIRELVGRADRIGVPQKDLRLMLASLEDWGVMETRGMKRERFLRKQQADASVMLLNARCYIPSVREKLRVINSELHVFEGIHAPTAENFRKQVLPFLVEGLP